MIRQTWIKAAPAIDDRDRLLAAEKVLRPESAEGSIRRGHDNERGIGECRIDRFSDESLATEGAASTVRRERVIANHSHARFRAGAARAHSAPEAERTATLPAGSGALRRYREIAIGLAISDAACVVVALAVAYQLRYPDRSMLAGEGIVMLVAPVLWVAVFRLSTCTPPSTCRRPRSSAA